MRWWNRKKARKPCPEVEEAKPNPVEVVPVVVPGCVLWTVHEDATRLALEDGRGLDDEVVAYQVIGRETARA